MTAVDVTILMPCLNEAQTLPTCIAWAKEALAEWSRRGLGGEILICDNGSDDGSQALATNAGCRVTHCPIRGYGAALIHGCREARGRYIVMGDADASYDFREAVPMVEKLREGFDLCMGNRFAGHIQPGAMPWKNRYIGNPALSGILNLFYRSNVHDAHCGLRAFTREAFDRLKLTSRGMEFASEMVVKAALQKMRTAEVPITLHPDGRGRPPHLRPWRDGWRHLKFLLLLSPRWLYFIPSGLLMLVSATIILLLLLTPRDRAFTFGDFWIGDHWMVLAGGLFTLGVGGAVLGLIATAAAVELGYKPPGTWSHRLVRLYIVDRAMGAALVCVIAGLGVLGWVIYDWSQNDFGTLQRTREMVLTTVLILTGAQIGFGSFIIALMGTDAVE